MTSYRPWDNDKTPLPLRVHDLKAFSGSGTISDASEPGFYLRGRETIMGSKNFKAIVARGREYKCVPVDPAMFEKNMKKVTKYILRNNMTRAYRLNGTNANTRHGIRSGYFPARNFRDRYNPAIEATSGGQPVETCDKQGPMRALIHSKALFC